MELGILMLPQFVDVFENITTIGGSAFKHSLGIHPLTGLASPTLALLQVKKELVCPFQFETSTHTFGIPYHKFPGLTLKEDARHPVLYAFRQSSNPISSQTK